MKQIRLGRRSPRQFKDLGQQRLSERQLVTQSEQIGEPLPTRELLGICSDSRKWERVWCQPAHLRPVIEQPPHLFGTNLKFLDEHRDLVQQRVGVELIRKSDEGQLDL